MRHSIEYRIRAAEYAADTKLVSTAFFSFAGYIERYYPAATRWFVTTVLPGFEAGNRGIWIAEASQQPVAMAVLKWDVFRRRRAKICTLFVDPTVQRQGIGTALLSHLVEWHDREMFLQLCIRCPMSVQPALEPLLRRAGFLAQPGCKPIPVSLAREVGFERINPLQVDLVSRPAISKQKGHFQQFVFP